MNHHDMAILNYYNMTTYELKALRAKKLVEYSVKRIEYTKLCEEGSYITAEEKEKFSKKMETIENEICGLEDLIYGLNHLIRNKENR
jgi:hypothetical protein